MALSVNFAMSFAPERRYLEALLSLFHKYPSKEDFEVACGEPEKGVSLVQMISDATGIPTGKSSGKVKPHLDYLTGMNLIVPASDWYDLTPFGRVLWREDRFLSERISLVACHGMLCDCNTGSPFYAELMDAVRSAGSVDRNMFAKSMKVNDGVMTAFCSMYNNETSFAKAGCVCIDGDGMITMKSAPTTNEYLPLYGAMVAHLMGQYFDDKVQVSIQDFDSATHISARFGFHWDQLQQVFSQLASAGYVSISALVNPPAFTLNVDEAAAWSRLYDNLI